MLAHAGTGCQILQDSANSREDEGGFLSELKGGKPWHEHLNEDRIRKKETTKRKDIISKLITRTHLEPVERGVILDDEGARLADGEEVPVLTQQVGQVDGLGCRETEGDTN